MVFTAIVAMFNALPADHSDQQHSTHAVAGANFSTLPETMANLTWLDVSSASFPGTEVTPVHLSDPLIGGKPPHCISRAFQQNS